MVLAVSASSQSLLKLWTISLMLFSSFSLMAFSFLSSAWHLVSSSFSSLSLQQGRLLEWFSWSYRSRQFFMLRFQFSPLRAMMVFSRMETLFLRLSFSLQSSLMVTQRSMETLMTQSSLLRCWLLGLVTRWFSLRSASTFSSAISLSTSLMKPRTVSVVTGQSYSAIFLASIFFIMSVIISFDFWFSLSLWLMTCPDLSSFLLLPFSCRFMNFLSNSYIFSAPGVGFACFSIFFASFDSFCLSKAVVRILSTSFERSSLGVLSSFFTFLARMGISAGSQTSSSKYIL